MGPQSVKQQADGLMITSVTQYLEGLILFIRYLKKGIKCNLVQALRLCTGHTAYRGSRGIGKGKMHLCTGTEALYRPYGP